MKTFLPSLKKVFAIFFLFLGVITFGQVSNYSFSQSTGTYTAVASPTTVHASGWDDAVASVTIPFTFNFNGANYTSASVNTNGYLTFGTTSSASTNYNPISQSVGYAGAISAFGRDLISNSSTIVSGVVGSTPNRVFVVQWNNARRYNSETVIGDVLNFQIRLYETSNIAEVRYGSNSATSTLNRIKGQVGLRGSANTDYKNRKGGNDRPWNNLSAGDANDNTVNFKDVVVPASGLTFTWTPPSCLAPSLAATTAIGVTTATINWTAPSPAPSNGYNYEIRTSGAAGSGATGLAASGSTAAGIVTASITGLLATTSYSVYVRSNCGGSGTSAWTAAGTFTTTCAIVNTFPYTMEFDGTAYCWNVSTGTNIWSIAASSIDISAPHSGTGFALKPYSTSTQYLYSPGMNLSILGTNQAQLNFWIYRHSGTVSADEISFKVNTSASNIGATNLRTIPILSTLAPVESASGWYNYIIDIPLSWNSAGTIYFVIEGKTTAGVSSYDIGLDKFVIEQKPAPITVTSSVSLPICNGNSTTLTATSSTGYTYTWSPATGLSATTGASVVATPALTTLYTVTGTSGSMMNTKSINVTVNPAPSTISLTQTVQPPLATGCVLEYVKLEANGGNVLANLIEEDFEGTFPGWTAENFSSGGTPANADWTVVDSPYLGFQTIDNGSSFAITDSDRQGFGGTTQTFLNAPPIDTRNFTNLSLNFDQFFRATLGDLTAVLVSIDNINFDMVYNSGTSSGTATSFENRTIDLSAYINNPAVYISFGYLGNYSYYWALDNIKVFGDRKEIIWSPTAGLFTDTALEIPYTGQNLSTLYAAPDVSTTFTATASVGTCDKTSATTTIQRTKKLFTGLALAGSEKLWGVKENWSTNTVPSLNKCVNIPNGKEVIVNVADAAAKNIIIDNGGKLTISKDQTLTITDDLVNNNAVENIDFVKVESDGNLIQINNTTNTGTITADRLVTNLRNIPGTAVDYVYWSSPVANQKTKNSSGLKDGFSPGTPNNRFFYYRESNDRFYETGDLTFTAGRGYAVKVEDPALPNPSYTYTKTYQFRGQPNNGDVTINIFRTANNPNEHGFNLVGNPYPSNINFQNVFEDNSTVIFNTVYFWKNTNYISTQAGGAYNGNNYTVYNGTGGVDGTTLPDDVTLTDVPIAKVGQGFIIQKRDNGSGTLTFNNTQRVDTSGTFYQKGSVEKSRFTLHLLSPSQVINSQMIGYVPGATDGFEQDYDAEAFDNYSDLFYSLLPAKKLVIQGKGANFSDEDKVMLGANFFQNGSYTIALDKTEGIFANGQNIYLKDKQTGIVTNLSQGSYPFIAPKGDNTGRFEIIYKPETVLATDTKVKEQIVVYRDADNFVIKSPKVVSQVEVYDGSGKLTVVLKPNNTTAILEAATLPNGVYILKIKTKDGETVSRKIVR